MESHDIHGIGVSALLCGFGRDAETQRNVRHVVHDDTLVLRGVFRDATQPAFQDVMAVEELLFGARLEPDLEFGVRSEKVGGSDVEAKFASFRHFAEASAEGKKKLPVYRRSQLHHV